MMEYMKNMYIEKTDKKYEAIFCDLDGTLLEDKMRHYKCYQDIVHKYGGQCVSLEIYWNDKRNKIKRTVLLEKTHFQGTYEDYLQEWLARIEQEEYLKHETLKPDIMETIDYIKAKTEKLVLITMRNQTENLLKQLEWLDLINKFDEIHVGKSLDGKKKSDLVNKTYGKSAIVIGDTEDDMQLAQKINSPFLGITNGLRNEKYLKADYLLEELHLVQNQDIL